MGLSLALRVDRGEILTVRAEGKAPILTALDARFNADAEVAAAAQDLPDTAYMADLRNFCYPTQVPFQSRDLRSDATYRRLRSGEFLVALPTP
ncbi:hypothetical protein [Actinoallomurus iriomotensis]|nr:hypothetical protein [Actinoallomurus iriomotensis]